MRRPPNASMPEAAARQGLSDAAITQIDEFWAAAMGSTLADLRSAGIEVVERPGDDGTKYVQLFKRGPRLQIAASASLIHMFP